MAPRVLSYVQHLLGVGHLVRAARLAEALAAAGADVTMVAGGVLPPDFAPGGARLARLDPVRVEAADMRALLTADGAPFDATRQAARRDALLALFAAERPDILVIEAFPFGRRQMRFELTPLLEAARAGRTPVVASSIRDILQEQKRPERQIETCETVERFFDLVLVHGEATTPLSETFPLAERIVDRTVYCGMVGPPAPAAPVGDHDVIVSAGGGAVGEALIAAALAALADPRLADLTALALTGAVMPAPAQARLRALARPGRIEVATHVGDLPARLARARLSVSQAGYNTVAELIATGCPAVLAPFAAQGETEQTRRAEALARVGRAIVFNAQAPDGAMAAAMLRALALPRPTPQTLDGAARAARVLLDALARRSGRL